MRVTRVLDILQSFANCLPNYPSICENLSLTNNAFYTGGLSTSAVIKVDVLDVNDNWPVFSPSEYNVSIVWTLSEQGPIVTVRAKDLDSGSFGVVSYYLISAKGNVNYVIHYTIRVQ